MDPFNLVLQEGVDGSGSFRRIYEMNFRTGNGGRANLDVAVLERPCSSNSSPKNDFKRLDCSVYAPDSESDSLYVYNLFFSLSPNGIFGDICVKFL